jgi:hypothetical protein
MVRYASSTCPLNSVRTDAVHGRYTHQPLQDIQFCGFGNEGLRIGGPYTILVLQKYGCRHTLTRCELGFL